MRISVACLAVACSCGCSSSREPEEQPTQPASASCSEWTTELSKKLAAAHDRRTGLDVDAMDLPILATVDGSSGIGPLIVATETAFQAGGIDEIPGQDLERRLRQEAVRSCESQVFRGKPACVTYFEELVRAPRVETDLRSRARAALDADKPPSELERDIAASPEFQRSAQRLANELQQPKSVALPESIKKPPPPDRPVLYIAADKSVSRAQVAKVVEAAPALFELRLLVHKPDDRDTFGFARKRSAPAETWREKYQQASDAVERAVAISEGWSQAITGCAALVEVFGNVASVETWAKEQYIAIKLPEAIAQCRCEGVELEMTELVALATFSADRRPGGWLQLPRPLPAAANTGELAAKLSAR